MIEFYAPYQEYLYTKNNRDFLSSTNKDNMIYKLSDLSIGVEYYVSSSPQLRFTKLYRLIAIDFEQCTIEIEYSKGYKLGSRDVYEVDEIGIGTSKEEAIKNYGQIKLF